MSYLRFVKSKNQMFTKKYAIFSAFLTIQRKNFLYIVNCVSNT